MQTDLDLIVQQCIEAINDKIRNLNKLNIMIIGKSGVGKSTLINSLFRGNFTETGLGRPVTSEVRKLEKKIIRWQFTILPALNYLPGSKTR